MTCCHTAHPPGRVGDTIGVYIEKDGQWTLETPYCTEGVREQMMVGEWGPYHTSRTLESCLSGTTLSKPEFGIHRHFLGRKQLWYFAFVTQTLCKVAMKPI